MAFRIITVPFVPEQEGFAEEALNEFCLNKKILSFKAEFFANEVEVCMELLKFHGLNQFSTISLGTLENSLVLLVTTGR